MSRIVVNHLTRMGHPRVCVAGIDIDAGGAHLRPVTPRSVPLTTSLLTSEGGPFGVGALVELGETRPAPEPPFVEDQLFNPAAATSQGRVEPELYTDWLEAVAFNSLRRAFGPDLERLKSTKLATREGLGTQSLAVVRLTDASMTTSFGKPRLNFYEDDLLTQATVTDLRFYEDDFKTANNGTVASVSARLAEGVKAWAMFGFARPFKASGDDARRNWLQLNGICLEDDPFGP